MKVAVSGSSGLLGRALCQRLKEAGHEVVRIVRSQSGSDGTIAWNPQKGSLETQKLEGLDAVVHLAGENIASKRWTNEQKKKIRDSRVEGTTLLATALSKLSQPPKVLVSSSAIGFYGDRGDESLTESSPPGKGFLADVCQAWEAATEPASAGGIRVVNLRTGVALSTEGGALNKMLPIFQLGGGGDIGSGKQYMSWISLDDEIAVILFALTNSALSGPVNAVSPHAVTNHQFTQVLGQVMHRPTVLPLPAFAAKIIMGEMADELLLSSQRVVPEKLLKNDFSFSYPDLAGALKHALKHNGTTVAHAI